jgi:uncharacterized protein YaiI (UPF0178 family)
MMKILVDADACPVKDIIVRVAKQLNLRVLMFIDTSHSLNDGYSEVTTVDKGRDSVDIALINQTQKNDIIITQDYGVAAMALAKQAHCINQNGLIYTNENIDSLLFERHLSQKVRRAGGKTGNPRKRTQEDNERFEKAFRQLCNTLI